MAAMCRHYRWPHDFWRQMGRREFSSWVEQMRWEIRQESGETDPDTWRNADRDPFWQQAKEKREKMRGR